MNPSNRAALIELFNFLWDCATLSGDRDPKFVAWLEALEEELYPNATDNPNRP